MNLKYMPKDAEVGALVQMAMDMTQTAILRAYEIVEIEQRPLTDEERIALDNLITFYGIAGEDVRKLKMKRAN